MRRLAIVLSMMVLLLAVTPAVQADVSPFVGHWEGINEVPGNPELGDDSRMIINISAGRNGTVNVFFKDFGASACGTDEVTGEPLADPADAPPRRAPRRRRSSDSRLCHAMCAR